MNLLNNITNNGSFDSTAMLIALLTSIILGLIISFVHIKTSKYSKNFIITLAILPLLVQVIIMLVNGNLGTSVAILGAFSLVRFRSIPGNSREIVSVFFAMVIGLAIGTGFIIFSIMITLIVCLLLIIFSKTNFGNIDKNERKLTILIAEDLDYTNIFDDIFKKYTKSFNINKVKTVNMGSIFQLEYCIILKNDVNEKDFIDEIRVKNGNLKIVLSQPLNKEEL